VLVAFGRYTGHGSGAVKVTGTINGKSKEFAADVKFTENDTTNAYIPRLWAVRRVGWLLDEMRLHGESKELKDEVVRLARAHGIVTPYTAYLIMEDERGRGVPMSLRNLRELEVDRAAETQARQFYQSTQTEALRPEARGGAQAVTNAQSLNDMKFGANLQQQQAASDTTLLKAGVPGLQTGTAAATTQPFGYRRAQNYAQQARVVAGRAFYQNGDTWTDSTIQSNQNAKQVQVKFDSDEYFALLKKYPDAAPWMSLGNNMDVMLDDTIYSIR
jgi:Ca-activated chloride channel family protein